MKPESLKRLTREVEAWGDRFTPPCACGCGEPVRIGLNKMNKYVNNVHRNWDQPNDPAKARAALGPIPIDKFREAVYRLKDQKGLTFDQLAELGGVQDGHLSEIMFNKKRVFVKRSFVEQFLRRVAGMSVEPSVWQKRQVRAMVEHDNKARIETDAARMPRTRVH